MNHSPFDLLHQNDVIDHKIIAALERVSQAFRVLLWKESVAHSLSPIQIQVLIFLLHHSEEKRKVSYLAEEFNMSKATISDTIKTLDQKELITKTYDPHDTRSYTIHLTEKGKEITQQTALFTQEIETPIANIKRAEKENLLLSLIEIIHHLNETGVISIQRMCTTCSFYTPDKNGGQYFCKLLNIKLENRELRVDCPEHLYAE